MATASATRAKTAEDQETRLSRQEAAMATVSEQLTRLTDLVTQLTTSPPVPSTQGPSEQQQRTPLPAPSVKPNVVVESKSKSAPYNRRPAGVPGSVPMPLLAKVVSFQLEFGELVLLAGASANRGCAKKKSGGALVPLQALMGAMSTYFVAMADFYPKHALSIMKGQAVLANWLWALHGMGVTDTALSEFIELQFAGKQAKMATGAMDTWQIEDPLSAQIITARLVAERSTARGETAKSIESAELRDDSRAAPQFVRQCFEERDRGRCGKSNCAYRHQHKD
ncbi:uncharacterized protein L969DRAFT_280948 [Mixia osmundae IAM 14324]|uniref:Uncharacterized protein n=1 Tax=Mixia osmundae (strain CBS 9802 / IAM 14324 / JCM 22182 / KY 12970) TaxID=764103 RepID=G7E4C1_MIXOS|nr:uncharacterized protein L969DRAFT_332413 [Mixia osmundae IAM 14324]XP_014564858.1 uncharacterized protein L969DRAFT_280948 [Mixia osmundae IAM 14324]KEI36126.1 hypothetical protein L969DRAFT_332413 [Mixia osmundae IAM 14324]KEI36302.1 hypothetical protein L969DRAFT_280948 [Mixia osmundae IAM 14324]GAA97681.1 hypothetical protein E5Q_04359 [Mixia osmundae IAM 14324]